MEKSNLQLVARVQQTQMGGYYFQYLKPLLTSRQQQQQRCQWRQHDEHEGAGGHIFYSGNVVSKLDTCIWVHHHVELQCGTEVNDGLQTLNHILCR